MQQYRILTIHGIRTHAKWQKEYSMHLQKKALVYHFSYGWAPVTVLFSSGGKKVDELYKHLKQCGQEEDQALPLCVVAHSYGTVLLLKCLQKYNDIYIDTLFLAGSIIDENYDWYPLVENGQIKFIVNYVASDDKPIKLGGVILKLLKDCGQVGVRGFLNDNRRYLVNCQLDIAGHKSLTESNFIDQRLWPLLPHESHRKNILKVNEIIDLLLSSSLLPLGLPEAGDVSFLIPDLFIGRQLNSWSGGSVCGIQTVLKEQFNGNPKILLLGDAGSGKTFQLLQYFLICFNEKRSYPFVRLPIWISLAELSMSDGSNCKEVISNYLRDNYYDVEKGDYILFLDGLDENPKFVDSLTDLAMLDELPGCKQVIITSRSNYILSRFSEQEIKENFNCVLDIAPWDDKSVKDFANRYIRKAKMNEEARKDVSKIFEFHYKYYKSFKLNGISLVASPLISTMVVALLCQGVITQTRYYRLRELYDKVLKLWGARERVRSNNKDELTDDIYEQLRLIAWNIYLSRFRDISHKKEKMLECEYDPNVSGPFNKILLSYLHYKECADSKLIFYGFIHETFIEYLVADRMIKNILDVSSDNTCEIQKLLTFPINEIVAFFIKEFLEDLTYSEKTCICEKVKAAIMENGLPDIPNEQEITFVNASLYLLGRVDHPLGFKQLLYLWNEKRALFCKSYPQAYITLLSGISLANAFEQEEHYSSEMLKYPESEEVRFLIGWYLFYYGDRPAIRQADYLFGENHLPVDKWIKSRNALLERINNNASRHLNLRVFYLCGFWAMHSYSDYELSEEEQKLLSNSIKYLAEKVPSRINAVNALSRALKLNI